MITFYDDKIWDLKHRPTKLSDLCLPSRLRLEAENIIKTGNVPNMLFSGRAGIGKTTLALILANTLDYDLLYKNCALDRSIDVIRTEFKSFASTVSLKGKKKIIIGDEFDRLTPEAQDSLKSFIEQFSSTTSFIFISNNIEGIASPIISRLKTDNFDFTLSKKEVGEVKTLFAKRLVSIFKTDKIEYDNASIKSFINTYFPDMRKILTEMQSYHSAYGSITNANTHEKHKSDIDTYFKLIKTRDYMGIRTWLENSSINPTIFYQMCYNVFPKYIDLKKSPEAILYLGDRSFEAMRGVDLKINISAFSMELMSCESK
jgi:replication factor C small subunit